MLLHKRGNLGNQIMVFPFIFLVLLVGIGLVIGVGIFFGSGNDSRDAEARLLNYKIQECIIYNYNGEDIKMEDFFERCRLNKKVIEENNIIRVCKDSKDCASEKEGIIDIGGNFQSCKFTGVKENSAYPRCDLEIINVKGQEFEVISGSRQFSRRLGL